MSNNKVNKKNLIIGFCILLVIGVLTIAVIWWATSGISNFFTMGNPAVVAAVAAGLLSVGAVIWAKIWEARYKVKHELRLKKSPVYEEFFDFMMNKVLLSGRSGDPDLEKEISEFFRTYQGKLLVWGGEKVLKEFIAWRALGATVDQEPSNYETAKNMFRSFDNIFRSMRKDLGHSNKGMKELDFIRLFVKNFDRDLAAMKIANSNQT